MGRASLKNVARLLEADKVGKVEESFLNDLKRSIEITAEKGSGKPPSRTYKPSSMNCPRVNYYQLTEEIPDKSDASYNFVGICNSGSDIHERLQTAVSKMSENEMDCDYVDVEWFVNNREIDDVIVREKKGMETKLYNNRYNISFMCDGIIKYKGKYYILEIKTETSRKWFSRTGVDKKHYNQAICYSLSLKLDTVIFLYVNRDTLDLKAFRFDVDESMRQHIKDYISEVDGYVERQITPPKLKDMDRRVCNYCGYKTACRRDN